MDSPGFVFVVTDADDEPVGVFTTLEAAKAAADIYSKTQSYCHVKQFMLNAECDWQDDVLYNNLVL